MMRFVSLAFAASACTFSPGSPSNAMRDDGGNVIRPDTYVPPDAGMCLQTGPTCIGNVLRVCKTQGQLPTDTRCDWGCSSNGPPHCQSLKPAGGAVQPSDLLTFPGATSITISQAVTINTDTGSISSVRAGGTGVISGIGYTVRNNVGVFTFQSLTITGPITFTGNNGVAFVAVTDIVVKSLIDARGSCSGTTAGPGGFSGGNAQTDGQGSGKGTAGAGTNNACSGGGGAGHGIGGAKGGKSPGTTNPPGGSSYGDAVISTLVGGSGGGGGGANGGVGGGGGGALQLAANGTITIDNNGGLNAGGCGGKASGDAGGGGGAGGTILIEGLTIHLVSGSQLGANGGGGGGGAGSAGRNADFSEIAVAGGSPGQNGGDGGFGGARLLTGGSNGTGDQNSGGGPYL